MKMKKFLLSAAVLSSLILVNQNQLRAEPEELSSHAPAFIEEKILSDNLDRPEIITSKLEVNTSNLFRNVTYGNFESGLFDMRKLAGESIYEEAWVYIPKETKWIELCRKETNSISDKGGGKFACFVDLSYLEALYSANEDLIFAHIHTLDSITKKSDFWKVYPSVIDLEFSLQTNVKISNGNGNSKRIKHLIVSSEGYTFYEFDLDELQKSLDLDSVSFNNFPNNAISSFREEIIKGSKDYQNGIISKDYWEIQEGPLKISFTPFKD